MREDTETNLPETNSETERTSIEATPVELELFVGGGTEDPSFKLTETGVSIDENMTYEAWVKGLKAFKWMQSKLKLGFADYVKFGRSKFGEEVVNASLTQLEFDLPSVNTALQINSIPEELRKPGLEADHFVILAKADLKPKQKVKWAEIASVQKLSPSQLKASIAAGEVVSPAVARQLQHGIVSVHGIRQEFDIWLRRAGGLEGIRKLEPQAQSDICNEMQAIVDLYLALNPNTRMVKLSEKQMEYVDVPTVGLKVIKAKKKPAKKKAKKPAAKKK